MRVSQIQNLTWAGNVVLLLGLAWVGWQFWDARKQKAAATWTWEKSKDDGSSARQPWPGDLAKFRHVWDTNVSGKVPPPPPPPPPPVPPDPVREFKAGLKYLGGWEFPDQPERSTARVSFAGKDLSITPGTFVGDFQFLQLTIEDRKDPKSGDVARIARLVFKHPQTGEPVVIDQVPPPVDPLAKAGGELFVPAYGPGVAEGPVDRSKKLERQAFRDPTSGDWVIPAEEQAWIGAFGETDLLKRLATKPEVDAQGKAHGLRINSMPESGTPLAPTHGITQGDVVRSINGVAVGSKEDILNYLRGAGRGLDRYEVVVDRGGNQSKIVYRVPRPVGVRR